jgi:hypothetical protein
MPDAAPHRCCSSLPYVRAPALSVVEHLSDQSALRPSPHSPCLPAPILSARARRARPRHGQPSGAHCHRRFCSSIAPFSSLTPPSASCGSGQATPLPLGRCAAPPRCRCGEATAVSPARVARRPRMSTGHAEGGHGSASPPCSFRAAPPPPGRRQPAGGTAAGHLPPPLLRFHRGNEEEGRLSLSPCVDDRRARVGKGSHMAVYEVAVLGWEIGCV